MTIRWSTWVLFLALVACFVAGGCGNGNGGGDSQEGPPENISGVWSGTYQGGNERGTIIVTIQQTGNTVKGTWEVDGGAERGTFTGKYENGVGTFTAPGYGTGIVNFSGNRATAAVEGFSFSLQRA